VLRERIYQPDVAILKSYNGVKNKITLIKTYRTPGLEIDEIKCTEKGTVNTEKLENNISRAKSKIYELSLCNEWQQFVTLTLNKEKYDRNDLEKFIKDFGQYIRNFNKKNNLSIKYLLIPEVHKKGGWHMHGLLQGLPESFLRAFTLQEHIPTYIRDKIKSGGIVYDWEDYKSKFGFCDIEPIRNQDACAKYVTKYINKDLSSSIKELNAHLYYCSKGLTVAKIIKKGSMLVDIKPNYENEYVKIQWFENTEISLDNLKNYISSK
jgi:hypothetical protein